VLTGDAGLELACLLFVLVADEPALDT
jgi:hypothetical protein